ncbi:MAG: hypothetical protein JNK82_29515 [Myxococcaceae bacterium]|nr:hypothetical protein [Myxococcaceae bacterium]
MSTPGVRIRLVVYAPHGGAALTLLEKIRAGLPAADVSELRPLELGAVEAGGAQAKAFDYNSKMQLKGQTLEWVFAACDGAVQSMNARQALLKGVHGVLLFASTAADPSNLESSLQGDFDQLAGKNYALVVVAEDAAAAKGHLHLVPTAEAAFMQKELMKAALKVAAASM